MIEPGTLLQNRYRVAEQIGKGGMGEVYVATDERFQSTVAIKRTFFDDEEMSRAFRREARLLNHLRHAALPKVSDHFSEDGSQFLVMEFIEGNDFAELLTKRKVPFPLADVLRWADELLDALEYLHTHEPAVVHRDIKPPNIKLTPRGKVVLLDFGLAKGAPSQTGSATSSSVFGFSLNFAPLEQMQGSGTDPRSDLYSLAATLYSLLTGVRPPDAVTRAAAAIKEQPDPLRPAQLVQAQVPATVGQILHRAMSLNPALRHSTAAELRAALRRAAAEAAPRAALSQDAEAELELEGSAPPEVAAPVDPSLETYASLTSAPPSRPRPARVSHSFSQAKSEAATAATRLDSRRPTRPLGYGGSTVSATIAAPAVKYDGAATTRKPKLLFACLVILCVATGAYLFARPSGSSAAQPAPAGTEAQNAAPSNQQVAPSDATAPAASAPASAQSHAAPGPNAATQPARAAGETPASNTQPAEAGQTDAAAQNPKGAAATPESASGAAGTTSTDRTGLVIQNPATAINPATVARRAEEARRDQQSPRPEYGNQPPPGAAFPPPDGRRPPPPDGRRPPPPHPRPIYP